MGRSVDSIWSGVQSSFGSFILLELLKVLITEGLVSMAAFRNTGLVCLLRPGKELLLQVPGAVT